MPELGDLMGDIPEGLTDDNADVNTAVDDDDEELEDDAAAVASDDDGAGEDDDDEEADDEGAGKAKKGKAADEDDDDDFVVDLDEDDDKPAGDKPADKPAGMPNLTDENQYILDNLPKIRTNILIRGSDGKDTSKEVEVYGWGQLLSIPGYNGFATPVDQGAFTANAQNNENTAQRLKGEFQTKKATADTEAYTMRENRAIARDLQGLRSQGIFPKFRGVPGSEDFNKSEGAKTFDEVVAFMNEQNDEAGQAAQKGGAFYHISFKQAYRMLHPEAFNTKKAAAQRESDRKVARRVKSGGGTKPERNVKSQRVSNINDLAGEFAAFTGGK